MTISLQKNHATPDSFPSERAIGNFIRKAANLSDVQVQAILTFQENNGVRYGEAAIALKLATKEQVLWALSQQFHYPYSIAEGKHLNHELVIATDPFSRQSEVIRGIRSQLLISLLGPDRPRTALAILSPNPGDGKTFFAANIAVAFSQMGDRVLLVDGDMRAPRLHSIFGIAHKAGLSSLLAGLASSASDLILPVAELPSLYVLPLGILPPNPTELLQRPIFAELLEEMLTKFDRVIFDSPAAIRGADARILAAKCGSSLMIARQTHTRMSAASALVQQIKSGPSQFAGIILNEH